jgi:uncharacterized protein YbjT (DUF2867 family)
MRIAVAGGTGVVGTPLVAALQERGHEVVVLARATGTDLLSGEGLAGRLAGVAAVVDVLSTPTSSRRKAETFFTTTTRNLLAAEQEAGVGHHVVLSIVGIDDVPFGYYQAKVAQEGLVTAGPVPWTIVRAPQFHEFAGQLLARTSFGPFAVAPKMLAAPMAAAEVAAHVADLAPGAPQGRTTDLRGPETLPMHELVKRVSHTLGPRRRVLAVGMPGKVGRGMTGGALVATDPAVVGTQTFDAWLAARR